MEQFQLDIILKIYLLEISHYIGRTQFSFLEYLKLENIPIWIILVTPTLVILAIPISYYIFIKDKSILEGLKKSNIPLYNFLYNKWYIDEVYNFIFIEPIKKIGNFFWIRGDQKNNR